MFSRFAVSSLFLLMSLVLVCACATPLEKAHQALSEGDRAEALSLLRLQLGGVRQAADLVRQDKSGLSLLDLIERSGDKDLLRQASIRLRRGGVRLLVQAADLPPVLSLVRRWEIKDEELNLWKGLDDEAGRMGGLHASREQLALLVRAVVELARLGDGAEGIISAARQEAQKPPTAELVFTWQESVKQGVTPLLLAMAEVLDASHRAQAAELAAQADPIRMSWVRVAAQTLRAAQKPVPGFEAVSAAVQAQAARHEQEVMDHAKAAAALAQGELAAFDKVGAWDKELERLRKGGLYDKPVQHPCAQCGGKRTLGCSQCRATGVLDCAHCQEGRCGGCGGSGETLCSGCKGQRQLACATCQGSGQVIVEVCEGGIHHHVRQICGSCAGRGHFLCGTCSGAGKFICGTCRGQRLCGFCGGQAHLACALCGKSGQVDCPACEDGTVTLRELTAEANAANAGRAAAEQAYRAGVKSRQEHEGAAATAAARAKWLREWLQEP